MNDLPQIDVRAYIFAKNRSKYLHDLIKNNRQLVLEEFFEEYSNDNKKEILKFCATENDFDTFNLLMKQFENDLFFDDNILLKVVVVYNKYDFAKYLLENGADATVSNNLCLNLAIQNCNKQMLELLIEYDVNIRTKNDYALRFAASCGDYIWKENVYSTRSVISNDKYLITKFLLTQGADVHADNDYALRIATKYNYNIIVALLIDFGANVHADNDYALRIAAKHNSNTLVNLLIEFGANVHANNDYALRISARYGYDCIVKQLLISGANINSLGKEDLVEAVRSQSSKTIELLVNHGVDFTILNTQQSNTSQDVINILNLLSIKGVDILQLALILTMHEIVSDSDSD